MYENFWERRSEGDTNIKVVTEIRCEVAGWSELAQGGEEAGLFTVANYIRVSQCMGDFFYHNDNYQRVNKYFVFSTQVTTVKSSFE
jgi:hypothetical protein